MTRSRRQNLLWFLFAAPTLAFVGLFFLVPMVLNGVLAFTNWSGFSSEIRFVGLENFRLMLERGVLLRPIRLTVFYATTAMLLQNTAGLSLALALEKPIPVNHLFRTIFFVPVLISPLATGYIWRGLLSLDGPVNAFLGLFAGNQVEIEWLGIPSITIFLVAAVDSWKWFGFSTLVYIAGLNAIPTELTESAIVDGASTFRTFWHIKRPMLAPAFTYNITVTLIGAMSAFDVIMSTTMGGPGSASRVLNIIMYNQFGNGLFAFATAASFTITIMVIIVGTLLVWYLRSREVEL